jgi:hypothetical protein
MSFSGFGERQRNVCLSIVLQESFCGWDANSSSRRRDDRIIMRGTTLPCIKLAGDSGGGFDAALIGGCRLFPLSTESSHPVFRKFCNTISPRAAHKSGHAAIDAMANSGVPALKIRCPFASDPSPRSLARAVI